MSITARHKKPGAFRQLVNSLETTATEKRDKIIQSIAAEDSEMALHIESSIFHFEEFIGLNDAVIAEILSCFDKEYRSVALALYKLKSQALLDKFVKNMPAPVLLGYRNETETLKDVMVREQVAAQFRIIAKARELEAKGMFRLKAYAGNYPGMM